MPLPIIGWAVAAGAAAVAGAVANKKGKKKGYTEGYNKAEEEYQAQMNELLRQLDELQRQREHVKDQFRGIIEHVSSIDVDDRGLFSKIATFVKGYSTFHIYVMGVISVAKARCLELSLPQELCDELKGIIFGFLEGGFPENLKKDISEIWLSTDLAIVHNRVIHCQTKIPNHIALAYRQTVNDIEESVKGLYELNMQENRLEQEIRDLKHAG